jgi:osmotically-inducible protein OsmY
MNRACALLTGAGIGVTIMYFFDPVVGNRRRALVRDQLIHARHKAADRAEARYKDLKNRAYGAAAELGGAIRRDENPSDRVLVDRVRSRMGRHISHPRAIDVKSHDGIVSLSGPVLASEVDGLLDAVRSVSGVVDVDDRLDVHKSASGVAALQGGAAKA